MSIDRIQLLRNVGQFDSVTEGAQLPVARLALIYAENGRGKTTLATILRSAGTGDAQLINERRRLGSQHPPHVVLAQAGGAPVVFQNGAWSTILQNISVFDDHFVAENVCSGIAIETAHRQNLHELILGAPGVALNQVLQDHVARIEAHNRDLRALGDAIPPAARGGMPVDAFCALPERADVADRIVDVERQMGAAQAAEPIRRGASFAPFTLPTFDPGPIDALLARTFPDLDATAAANVQRHLERLGQDGAAWLAKGMGYRVSGDQSTEVCPFCAQDLAGSPLLQYYRAYFSEAYEGLKRDVSQSLQSIEAVHSDQAALAFERAVREAERTRAFWTPFLDTPEIAIDTVALTYAWRRAREAVTELLLAKQASPLEASRLTEAAMAAIDAFEEAKVHVRTCSNALQVCNAKIALVKERAATANVAALGADLQRLRATQARHSQPVGRLCEAYLDEKAAKAATELLRDQARGELDRYRQNVFADYQGAINEYLGRFNAGFRLDSVASVNHRGGSSCIYNVLINNQAVPLTAETGPSFRNTLSAGDRNTLALAFFFASLDQDPQLAQKIVVIDDPMTSLDEHRSLTTVQEMRRLVNRVAQVIVLSHSKPFLCAVWEGADTGARSAMLVARLGAGSTLTNWDVRNDCITENDRRHELVSRYLHAANPTEERQVASALRPILEAFARVAYPEAFPPGALLGPFINICEQRVNTPRQILRQIDIGELRALLDYANLFHHDSNPAWATQVINDQQLTHFAQRTLAFARRA